MIAPTETESRWRLDRFVEVMERIVKEAAEDPELLKTAPHDTPVGRLDETRAAKELRVVQPMPVEEEDADEALLPGGALS